MNWKSLIILIIITLLFIKKFQNNVVIEYSRSCNQENVSSQDCTDWNKPVKTKYYVNLFSQEIMFEGSYGPIPYAGCLIANKDYWYCDPSATNTDLQQNIIAYDHGKFTEKNSLSPFNIQTFGYLKYLLLKYKIGT